MMWLFLKRVQIYMYAYNYCYGYYYYYYYYFITITINIIDSCHDIGLSGWRVVEAELLVKTIFIGDDKISPVS